jgi:CHAT domain-containing protein/Tfp pilus assembly protein PilF
MNYSFKPVKPGMRTIIAGLFLFLICSETIHPQASSGLSRDELDLELRKAIIQKDEAGAIELIKGNRLLIKPFVDGLIRESISLELAGKVRESGKTKQIAEKAAGYFQDVFGEKSLSIGIGYLAKWSPDQKKMKLNADSLYALGTSLRMKEPEKAKSIYYDAVRLYKEITDERGESEVLGGLGLVYTNIDYDSSLVYYVEALGIREKVDDKVLIGNTLNSLGSINYSYLKDYQKALYYYDKAESVRREIGDLANLARTMTNMAQVYEKMGQSEPALKYYKQSFEINQNIGDEARVAESLNKSGAMLIDLARYPEAKSDLEKALQIYTDLHNNRGVSDALNLIGLVHLKMGNYNSAVENFNVAIKLYNDQNDLWGVAGVYNNLAIVLQKVGRTEKALDYYKNALGVYEKLKDETNILVTLNNIGTIYFDLRDYKTAEEYHTRGLDLSMEWKMQDQEANYHLNLANDQNLSGKSTEALEHYKAGFELARALNNPDLTWRFIAGLAENYETRQDWEKVVELNDTVLKILDDLRGSLTSDDYKTNFLAKEMYVYEDIINLLQTLNEKDKSKGYDLLAFRYAERCKSRTLLDLLNKTINKTDVTGLNANASRYNELQNAQIVSLEETQAMCPDKNTILIEYTLGDSSSCMWIITKAQRQFLKLPDQKKLAEQIETVRFALLNPQTEVSDFFSQSSSYLYQELIRPAEPYLSKKSKLIIIPDGVLNYLPFEILLTENLNPQTKVTFSDFPFLVKKYPISYAPSASVLKTLITQHAKAGKKISDFKKLFAYGDPLYEDSVLNNQLKFSRIENSGKEIENIASLFDPGESEILLRDKATEENFKRIINLHKFNYLHFATHGLINEESPDLSSLVLTSGKNSDEDGFLKASEIFNLELNANLVVLSACQTGLGKLVRGEGMIGLTRAFMYAGTPSVLVSLWSVSDLSTSLLLVEFYKNLIRNNFCKTDALRKAQLSLISDPEYSHPFHWAPFILTGDWR